MINVVEPWLFACTNGKCRYKIKKIKKMWPDYYVKCWPAAVAVLDPCTEIQIGESFWSDSFTWTIQTNRLIKTNHMLYKIASICLSVKLHWLLVVCLNLTETKGPVHSAPGSPDNPLNMKRAQAVPSHHSVVKWRPDPQISCELCQFGSKYKASVIL